MGDTFNPIVLQACYRESQVFLFANSTLYIPHLPLYFLDHIHVHNLFLVGSKVIYVVRSGRRPGNKATHVLHMKLLVQHFAHIALTKAELTASTNLSSESPKSEWAWDGVVDHIRQQSVFDSYACRGGGGREKRVSAGDREEKPLKK